LGGKSDSEPEDLKLKSAKMAEVDKQAPGLPDEVPKGLRMELERLQRQIKVLLNNYQVLTGRAEQSPEDSEVGHQIAEVKRYLITFSNQQNSVLESVRNFLSNLEEEKRFWNQQHSFPPPAGPVASKTKSRKKDKRKSREWQGAASSRNSRSASPDSAGEEAEQVFLAYFSPGPGCFPGHLEEYDVMCPPPSLDEHETEAEEMEESVEMETSSDREAFFSRLNLLTNEQGKRIEEVYKRRRLRRGKMKLPSYIPEVADKKYRQQNFLQSCLTSPPHLRRRTPAPRAALALIKPAVLPPPPPPVVQESRMGTRSRSPSTATRISQMDGTCDIDFPQEENSNKILKDEKVTAIEKEGMRDEKQLAERLQLRDSLRKRRIELLEELSEAETRKLELCQTKEVQRENRCRMLRQQEETEAKRLSTTPNVYQGAKIRALLDIVKPFL